MSALQELAEWASAVTLADIPAETTDLAASQILSQLAAIRLGLQQPQGRRLVQALGAPLQADVANSARVLAGVGAWLNMDDTAYAGHLAPSTVAVPLAFAYAQRLSGADLLRSVVLANECAARITAAATLGPFRGQTALHTHVVGTVAARLSCERGPASGWTNALALALSNPPWTLTRGFVTSDARLLHVPTAVRMGLDACDSAEAGLSGASDILEHPDGFLAQFASVSLPQAVTTRLGKRWHTDTLSFKLHPGGPGIDAAIDCAADLHRAMGTWTVDDISEVLVEASLYTLYAANKAEAYLDGPRSPIGAMVLTTPYPVATTLLHGDLSIDDFYPPALDDSRRWQLAAKVRLEHDPDMTRTLIRGDAPFGEAIRQAGENAKPWLLKFGGPELVELLGEPGCPLEDFTQATKPTPARVTVRMRDGREYTREYTVPLGGLGPDLKSRHRELVTKKFLDAGGPPDVPEAWRKLATIPPQDLNLLISKALAVGPNHG